MTGVWMDHVSMEFLISFLYSKLLSFFPSQFAIDLMSQYDLAACSSSEIMCRRPVLGITGSIKPTHRLHKATFVCPKTLWRSQCMSLSLHRMFPSGPVLFLWDILGLTEHIPLYFCFCHFLWIRKQTNKEEHDKWVSIAHVCGMRFQLSLWLFYKCVKSIPS